MRTRRSPRNQDILFLTLFPRPVAPEPVLTQVCWECRSYPKSGRSRGKCAASGQTVNGRDERQCFEPRAGGREDVMKSPFATSEAVLRDRLVLAADAAEQRCIALAGQLDRLSAVNAELLLALKNLVARIDANGGIGEYKGGPFLVMPAARQAIDRAEAQ